MLRVRGFHHQLMVLFILTFVSSLAGAHAGEVRVAVAANFKPVMDELEPKFEAQTGHDLVSSAGSTGKLYTQVINGAPYEVFLSADQSRATMLIEAGSAVEGTQFTYAIGRLVLWDPAGGAVGPDRLRAGDFRRLAMANPTLAPYGLAARQTLDRLGLADALADKIVTGENVWQAYAFVDTGNAELGLVALALVSGDQQKGTTWLVPGNYHDPIRQDAVLLTKGAENLAAQEFMTFLNSTEARAVIERFGYER